MTVLSVPGLQVVDLCTVRAAELEECWQCEARWWRQQLCWDVSDTLAALRRVVERRGVPGKAVRIGPRTVGYTYYGLVGGLGVIAGVHVLPEWSHAGVGAPLVQETVQALRQRGVSRIESPCVAMDCPWLPVALEQQGFQTSWRQFLRVELSQARPPAPLRTIGRLEPWQNSHMPAVAALMQEVYAGSIDAESNALYRTVEGCHMVLDNLLSQGSCGRLVTAASALVRHRGQGIGCILVTEIAPQQSHLVQIMVLPIYQQQGVGRMLLDYSMAQLATLRYATLSLIVSRANDQARKLYQTFGWQTIHTFPIGFWERPESNA